MLFLKQCYIILKLSIIFTNILSSSSRICCPSEIIKNKVEMEAQVEMQELFVTTNIRVLYVHWKECIRKKVNSQITALVYGTCFMQVFLTFLIFLSVSSIISHHLCGLSLNSLKIGMRSLGKVFHGSEETMQIMFFFKNCKIEVHVLQENFH